MTHAVPRLHAAALVAALLAFGAHGAASAKPRKAYVFDLTKISLAKGIPNALRAAVKGEVGKAITEHPELLPGLDADAPDPETSPKEFARYLKKRRLEVFKVNVEVTTYSQELRQDPDSPRRLAVSLSLHMFGETFPKRVMAFTGEGSASVMVDVGKKLRKRDSEFANEEALKVAVAEAVATSVAELKRKRAEQKKRKKNRTRRRKKN